MIEVVDSQAIEELKGRVFDARESAPRGVAIVGHGSRRSCGRAVEAGSTISTAGLLGWSHAPEDMTLIVGAGESISSVQERLLPHRQRLSVDPPLRTVSGRPDLGTVGGLVATADQGSLRYRYGGVRELVIGARYVTGDGVVAHSGSQVIKNVAGYEIAKVLVGSLGTLAILTDVAFRLHPLPSETFEIVVDNLSLAAACHLGSRLARQSVSLSALYHWDSSMVGRVEGEGLATRKLAERVARSLEVDLNDLPDGDGSVRVAIRSGDELSQRFALVCGGDDLVLRVACRSFEAHQVEKLVEAWCEPRPSLVSFLGSGIVDLRWDERSLVDGWERTSLGESVRHLRSAFPSQWWRQVPTWARDVVVGDEIVSLDPNAVALMRSFKAALDPEFIFERGRMGAWYELKS